MKGRMKIRGRKRLERRRLHRMAQAWGRTFARRLRKGRKGKLRRLTRSWGRSRNPRRRITKAQLSALEEAALVGALRPGRLRFLASGTRAPDLVRFARQRLAIVARRSRNPLTSAETREVRAWAYRLLRHRRLRTPAWRSIDYARASALMDVAAKYGRGRSRAGASRRATKLLGRASRLRNPVLQAILPAVLAGSASAVGMRLMDGVLNPRRGRNGRHGVERAPRHLIRPAQRLSGAKIIDRERASCLANADCRGAFDGYRRFHEADPVHLTRVNVADGSRKVTVRHVFAVGEAPEVSYQTWKHQRSNKRGKGGKKLVWVHKFGEGGGKRPLLVHDPKSGLTSYLGGSYRVTDWFHK